MSENGDKDSTRGKAWWKRTEDQEPSREPLVAPSPTASLPQWVEEYRPALLDINQPPEGWSAVTREAFGKWLEDHSPERIRGHAGVAFQLVLGKPRSRELKFAASVISQGFREHFFQERPRTLRSSGNKVARILEKLESSEKFEKTRSAALKSTIEPPTSEGYIEDFDRSASIGLPENPSRLWQPRKPGRPPASENGRLTSFIKEVYGPFMAEHRDELRSYIYNHDRPLYDAIITYERREPLPADIAIPDRNDRQLRNLKEAQAAGFPGMTKKQKLDAEATLARLTQAPKFQP